MMRQESAASAKGCSAHTQLAPRDGTKLRALYDLFMANKGTPVEVKIFGNSKFGTKTGAAVRLEQLRSFYGMDIRCIKRRGHLPGIWVLAGEWFGPPYVDYVADRLAVLDRKAARQ